MKRPLFAFSLPIALLTLASCSSGSVKETLGLNRNGPDEFRVVSRPPLSVPPQFNLRPPAGPGEPGPSTPGTDKQAEAIMFGTPQESGNTFVLQPDAPSGTAPVVTAPVTTVGKTMPESNFLERVGATDANPNIRQKLEEDKQAAHQTVEEEDSWWDVFSTTPAKKDPMVNAKKESERLKKNEETGQPVTTGETPEVKPKDTGVLGRVLGY